MANIYTQGNKLYLNYRVGGKRVRKATGLEDTPQNRKLLEKEVIPALTMKIKLGDFTKPEHKKFSHYFISFLVEHENDKSYHNQVYVYKKVNAHFGKYDVNAITRKMVKDYLFSMDRRNSTKRDYLNCIKGILDIALDDEAVERNVAVDITFKREEKTKVTPFNAEEVQLLLDNADGIFRNFLGISFYTGMRSGEVLGLMHTDICIDTISIKRSISKGIISTPKTLGSVRDIPMFEDAKPFIEDQMRRSDSLYLFDYGKEHLVGVDFFKRRWKNLIQKSGIEYRKLYSTRHTFITAMLNSGKFKIMDIAAIVGHTSPQMIMTNYAGFITEDHLKIDTTFNLFGHSMGIVTKSLKSETS
jgi:integrase